MNRISPLVAALAALVSSACATQQTPAPSTLTGFRTEMATPVKKTFQKETYLGAEQAPMGTIAFSPPEACRGISTFGGDSTTMERGDLITSGCGVLLTLLEEGAAKRGYKVVSWRNLVGSQRPVDYAAQANVDGLVEINQLTVVDERMMFGPGLERFAVYELHQGGKRVPREDYANDPALQQRCLATWPQPFTLPAFAIDAKLTTVKDGQLRATYRNTAVMFKGDLVTGERAAWWTESAAATTTETYENVARWNDLVSGLGLMGLGSVGLLIATWLGLEDPFPDLLEGELAAIAPAVVGGALFIAGAIVLFAGTDAPTEVSFTVPSDSPEPICQSKIEVRQQERTIEDSKTALRAISQDLLESILPPPTQR